MNPLRQAVEHNFVWDALSAAIAGRPSRQARGFLNINCPMCMSRGQSRGDTRFRCGVMHSGRGTGVHCFNCGFKTRFDVGGQLGRNMQDFLASLGVSLTEIRKLEFRAKDARRMLSHVEGLDLDSRLIIDAPSWPSMLLPAGSQTIEQWAIEGCDDPDFLEVLSYLYSRGNELAESIAFYWTPHREYDLNHRLLIPCIHDGEIVGWSGRHVHADGDPKYWSSLPPNLLFNTRAMTKPRRRYLILVEGILDAVAIDGVSVLGAKMTDQQATWLGNCGLEVIVVPDLDGSGDRLVSHALAHKWLVSFPRRKNSGSGEWWEPDVKDSADAVRRYGRLYTLQSILSSATRNVLEISLKRQSLLASR